jgi:DNA-directed DNA polymerase III (polc)
LKNPKDPLIPSTIEYAQKLEGSIRNIGTHACAIIIGRDDLTEHIPLLTAKDKDTGEEVLVAQYEGSCIEDVGMLKMDFLGLKTLSILREAVKNVKRSAQIDINLDTLSLEDEKTYALFSRGETVGVFQFESEGMRKWLSELKPNRFEDLIAMNALYRPGPMDYIPDYVDRKFGRKAIVYDAPEMEEYLKETYGITVYQEQVMLLSQKLAGFTKGQADTLRKAIGKKKIEEMQKMEELFKQGGSRQGHSEEVLGKIWQDWVAFAQYAFNKSHSTCYALLGYQTAYLKANYPAAFMAAVLSRNLDNMDEISKYMDECKRMGIRVLGPDVNESELDFVVNSQGALRFGMGGIKGVGSLAVEHIVQERDAHGSYSSVYDFMERAKFSLLNKRVLEGLVYAGAFDSFKELKRPDYFVSVGKEETFMDSLVRYGTKLQMERDSQTQSLFGGQHAIPVVRPEPVPAQDYSEMALLNKEKELIGMYVSAHPLDGYIFEIRHFTTHTLPDATEALREMTEQTVSSKEFCLAGLVTAAVHKRSKNNKPWASLTVEDFKGSLSFSLFGKDYEKFMQYLEPGMALFLRCLPSARFGGNSSELELRIKDISLLANVKDDLIKRVCLKLPVEKVTPAFRKELVSVVKRNKGKTRLEIKCIDQTNQLVVDFFSRAFSISMEPEVVEFLEKHQISYTL